jgi:hypothetical protein
MSTAKIVYITYVTCNLTLESCKKYIESLGWIDDGVWGPYSRIYKKVIDGKDEIIKLLTTDKVGDFDRVMSDFINEISIYEKLPIRDILAGIDAIVISASTTQVRSRYQ